MINFTTLTQTITAAIGAVVLSSMFLAASVGPIDPGQIRQAQTSAQVRA